MWAFGSGELKIHCFTFLPYKSARDQIWHCRRIGQGQPRVIIWINLVVLKHPTLHTKFKGLRPFGSREEDFLRFLPYMGMAAILVRWPGPLEQFLFPHPMEAPYKIWLWLAQWFLRRRVWPLPTMTREAYTYPISSPVSLQLRWAKNGCPNPLAIPKHKQLMVTVSCIIKLYTFSN